jgi:hypothetical protein
MNLTTILVAATISGIQIDASCLDQLTRLCQQERAMTAGACFDEALKKCTNQPDGFALCVVNGNLACQRNSSRGSEACWDDVTRACRAR